MLLCTAVVIAMRCECEDVTVVWSGTIFCTSRTFPVSLSSRCQIALGSECLSCADLLGTWSAIFTNRQHGERTRLGHAPPHALTHTHTYTTRAMRARVAHTHLSMIPVLLTVGWRSCAHDTIWHSAQCHRDSCAQ